MELDPRQRKRLRAALISAYPERRLLDLMLEDELEKDLNRVTQDEPTYDLTVKAVISWAESQGSVTALIIGASRGNSGNPQLQDFIRDELDTLLDHNFGPITQALTQDLWQLLRQWADFAPVLRATLSTLPAGSADARGQEIADLKDDELNAVVKGYILLRLLLQDYPQQHGIPSVLSFATELGQVESAPGSWQQGLNQWIQAVEKHCGCSATAVINPQDPNIATAPTDWIDGYLMIAVEPQGKEKYRLKSFIHLYNLSKTPQLLEEIPLDISDNPAEKGVLCTFDQVRELLATLVQETEGKLAQSQLKKRLGYRRYHLTIEFFLPFQHLGESVDLWVVPDLDDPIEIGRNYRVSVRSYDRIRHPGLLNRLEIAWEKFTTLISQPIVSSTTDEHFEHIKKIENQSWADYEINPDSKIGLKMSCPPPGLAADQVKLFKAIIRGSFPLVLWTRCPQLSEMENWETVLDRFITWDLLNNLGTMLDTIKSERRQAFGEGRNNASQFLGYHLSVMCDNPNRLPSSLEPLSEHPNP
jgi:hypothetical protein